MGLKNNYLIVSYFHITILTLFELTNYPNLLTHAADLTEEKDSCCQLSNNPNDVKFYLFPDTRNLDNSVEIVYESGSLPLQFQSKYPTVIVTHGFTSNSNSSSMQVIKNAFLAARLKLNIILVNWGPLSSPQPDEFALNWYEHVVDNVPIVGKRIGDFIVYLNALNVPLNNVYLVGHSLGAHAVGIAGKEVFRLLKQKVFRITGLDPALPLFYAVDDSKHLVKTDAQFVDVIHANMGRMGDMTRDGHIDFYPNGGETQPPCYLADNTTPMPGTCSHGYACVLYAMSINTKFRACPCSPFVTEYAAGHCSTKCATSEQAIMGFYCSPKSNGEFYLVTPEQLQIPAMP